MDNLKVRDLMVPLGKFPKIAGSVHIRDFIKPPQEGQIVDANDSLTKCFHLFVMNRHDSLFVREKGNWVGLLRFSDVFGKVSQTMKSCAAEPAKS
jgi:hypothetical protein